MAEVWWSPTTTDPTSGGAGAFVFTHGSQRPQRGRWDGDASQLFAAGSAVVAAG